MKKQAKSGPDRILFIVSIMSTIVMMLVAVAALIDLVIVEVPHIRTIIYVTYIPGFILWIICEKKGSEMEQEKITLTTRRTGGVL